MPFGRHSANNAHNYSTYNYSTYNPITYRTTEDLFLWFFLHAWSGFSQVLTDQSLLMLVFIVRLVNSMLPSLSMASLITQHTFQIYNCAADWKIWLKGGCQDEDSQRWHYNDVYWGIIKTTDEMERKMEEYCCSIINIKIVYLIDI